MNNNLMKQYTDALYFLDNHPAVNTYNGSFLSHLWYSCEPICKNQIIRDRWTKNVDTIEVDLYSDDKDFDKFVGKYGDEDDQADEFRKITVPYEEYYGYKWKLDKYSHCGEASIFKFNSDMLYQAICVKPFERYKVGNIYYGKEIYDKFQNNKHFVCIKKEIKDIYDERYYYQAYHAVDKVADNFEQLIIKISEQVKKDYGDFQYEDFYTEEEKEHNKNQQFCFFEPIDKLDSKGRPYSRMVINDNYIRLTDAELNLRWWDWYRTTEHYKKHWDGE